MQGGVERIYTFDAPQAVKAVVDAIPGHDPTGEMEDVTACFPPDIRPMLRLLPGPRWHGEKKRNADRRHS